MGCSAIESDSPVPVAPLYLPHLSPCCLVLHHSDTHHQTCMYRQAIKHGDGTHSTSMLLTSKVGSYSALTGLAPLHFYLVTQDMGVDSLYGGCEVPFWSTGWFQALINPLLWWVDELSSVSVPLFVLVQTIMLPLYVGWPAGRIVEGFSLHCVC